MSTSSLRRTTSVGLLISLVLLVTAFAPSASAGVASPCKVRNLNSDVLSTDLQDAIDGANAGVVLRVKGTCVGNFVIGKDLKLRGAAGGNAGILDGNSTGRTVDIASGVVTLRRLTITGGVAPDANAGGIMNFGTLTIRNSTITGNQTQSEDAVGGGIMNFGTLTVNSSTISGNVSIHAGGIWTSGTVTLNDSTITGNTASGAGGGMVITEATVTLNDSTITGNTAGVCGGGVFNGFGTLNILGTSSVTGNTPDDVFDGITCPG